MSELKKTKTKKNKKLKDLNIGFIVDPLDSIKPQKDTTLALADAAYKLFKEVYLIDSRDILVSKGSNNKKSNIQPEFDIPVSSKSSSKVFSKVDASAYLIKEFKVSCKDVLVDNKDNNSSYQVRDVVNLDFIESFDCSKLDIIIMRKDPPFDLEYVYITYMLSFLQEQGVKVINNPQGIRDVNEKFYIFNFPDLIADTIVSQNPKKIYGFLQLHQQIVLKPLNEMGGEGIVKLSSDDPKALDIIKECLGSKNINTSNNYKMFMAQKFVDVHKEGDKRVLLINGKPIAYALARFPKQGGFLANLAAGGSGKVVPLTERDYEICNGVASRLISKGLDFVGLDIVDGFLTEINVTSPTCLREINTAKNLDIATEFFKGLF